MKVNYIKLQKNYDYNLQESNVTSDLITDIFREVNKKIDEIKNLKKDVKLLKEDVNLLTQEQCALKDQLVALKVKKIKKDRGLK